MRFGRRRDGEGGPSALAGGCLAGAIIGATLLWRGELGFAVAAAIALAVLLSALLSRRHRPAAVSQHADTARVSVSSAAIHPDPVILVDRRSLIVEVNEAARALFPSLRERHPLALALRDPEVLDGVASIAKGGGQQTIEIGGRVPTEAVWEVRLRRVETSTLEVGRPAVALFFRDLSDARRLERMRVDFIANVSHELRTPLASLAGFIDTLKGPARDDEAARARFLDIMGAQAGRMTRLIDDLLHLSRVELREHLPPSDRVDLGLTASHMVEVMAPKARERGVSIALDLPGEPATILGDRDELLRLVENLVENAIKYGASEKPVEVSVRRLDGPGGKAAVELTVRDHGPGIAPEHLPRLTERFYRADAAESRKEGGTGLGLAIVKHIVGRHRGRLAIESAPGAGATFRARFPAPPEGSAPVSR